MYLEPAFSPVPDPTKCSSLWFGLHVILWSDPPNGVRAYHAYIVCKSSLPVLMPGYSDGLLKPELPAVYSHHDPRIFFLACYVPDTGLQYTLAQARPTMFASV